MGIQIHFFAALQPALSDFSLFMLLIVPMHSESLSVSSHYVGELCKHNQNHTWRYCTTSRSSLDRYFRALHNKLNQLCLLIYMNMMFLTYHVTMLHFSVLDVKILSYKIHILVLIL